MLAHLKRAEAQIFGANSRWAPKAAAADSRPAWQRQRSSAAPKASGGGGGGGPAPPPPPPAAGGGPAPPPPPGGGNKPAKKKWATVDGAGDLLEAGRRKEQQQREEADAEAALSSASGKCDISTPSLPKEVSDSISALTSGEVVTVQDSKYNKAAEVDALLAPLVAHYRGGAHYFCLELLLRGTFVCNRLDSENWEYESGPQWRPPLDALLARLRALCVADDVATGTGAAGTVGAALPPWPEALEGVDEAKFAEEMARASDGDEPVPESVRRTQREYFVYLMLQLYYCLNIRVIKNAARRVGDVELITDQLKAFHAAVFRAESQYFEPPPSQVVSQGPAGSAELLPSAGLNRRRWLKTPAAQGAGGGNVSSYSSGSTASSDASNLSHLGLNVHQLAERLGDSGRAVFGDGGAEMAQYSGPLFAAASAFFAVESASHLEDVDYACGQHWATLVSVYKTGLHFFALRVLLENIAHERLLNERSAAALELLPAVLAVMEKRCRAADVADPPDRQGTVDAGLTPYPEFTVTYPSGFSAEALEAEGRLDTEGSDSADSGVRAAYTQRLRTAEVGKLASLLEHAKRVSPSSLARMSALKGGHDALRVLSVLQRFCREVCGDNTLLEAPRKPKAAAAAGGGRGHPGKAKVKKPLPAWKQQALDRNAEAAAAAGGGGSGIGSGGGGGVTKPTKKKWATVDGAGDVFASGAGAGDTPQEAGRRQRQEADAEAAALATGGFAADDAGARASGAAPALSWREKRDLAAAQAEAAAAEKAEAAARLAAEDARIAGLPRPSWEQCFPPPPPATAADEAEEEQAADDEASCGVDGALLRAMFAEQSCPDSELSTGDYDEFLRFAISALAADEASVQAAPRSLLLRQLRAARRWAAELEVLLAPVLGGLPPPPPGFPKGERKALRAYEAALEAAAAVPEPTPGKVTKGGAPRVPAAAVAHWQAAVSGAAVGKSVLLPLCCRGSDQWGAHALIAARTSKDEFTLCIVGCGAGLAYHPLNPSHHGKPKSQTLLFPRVPAEALASAQAATSFLRLCLPLPRHNSPKVLYEVLLPVLVSPHGRPIASAQAAASEHDWVTAPRSAASRAQVREHSPAVERCGPHVAISLPCYGLLTPRSAVARAGGARVAARAAAARRRQRGGGSAGAARAAAAGAAPLRTTSKARPGAAKSH